MNEGRTLGVALAALLGALALVAPAAEANHHLIKIREIYPGTSATPDSAYIELQMFAAGQGVTNGQSIRTYNGTGTQLHTFTMDANAANAQNQRTVLIGDSFPPNAVVSDFTDTALGTNIQPGGGAVCFTSTTFGPIDCASWGAFTGDAMLPTSAGAPAAAIPDGSGLKRSIAPGCSTLLEGTDDTGQSSADFALIGFSGLDPRQNSATPTESACTAPKPPNTKLTGKPGPKTTDRTPKFKFESSPPGASFQCKLDKRSYKRCSSPTTAKKLSFGKHKFSVRAKSADGPDKSPAKTRFKVLKKKR